MSSKQKFILICLTLFFAFFLITGRIPTNYGSAIGRDSDPGNYWLIMLIFAGIILIILYRFLITWSKNIKLK
jgi:hypothetical protein